MTRWFAAMTMLTCVSLAGVTAQQHRAGAAPRQDYNSGEYLYRVFCASCHGDGGTGDGLVAGILRVPPPDLTAIAARNGGVFPADRIYRAIDGREGVVAHGPGQMPIWGDVLRVTEGQSEPLVKRRIDALVTHLRSIQRKPPDE